MRVLEIGMSWYPEQPGNGLDRMFYGLVHNLSAQGIEVDALVAGSEGLEADGAFRLETFGDPSDSTRRRSAMLRRRVPVGRSLESYNVIASHFALSAFPIARRLAQRPFVVHFHGPWAAESSAEGENALKTRIKWGVERSVYRRADRYIVLSEAFANLLSRSYGVDRDRVDIVPGGVDTSRFDIETSAEEGRRRLGWPTDRPVVLTVRRLVRRVGLEGLVEAFGKVVERHPDAILLIAGKGPLRNEIAARIERGGLTNHARLIGFVSEADLPTAYRAATLSVVPSISLEGFGLIAAESLAAGTPALVTPVGGLPEVVSGLSPSLVMRDASPSAMADHIAAVLSGRISMPTAVACSTYAQKSFDWAAIASKTVNAYRKVTA
jgi:glycosyltransferase involved in cell wall biosynthesis